MKAKGTVLQIMHVAFAGRTGRIDPAGGLFFEEDRILVIAVDPARWTQSALWPDAMNPLRERLGEIAARYLPERIVVLAVPERGVLSSLSWPGVPIEVVDRQLPRLALGGLVFVDGGDNVPEPSIQALDGPVPHASADELLFAVNQTWYLAPLGGFAEPMPAPSMATPVEYPRVRQ